MIVLDTNVVSEIMRLKPDETVMGWVHSRSRTFLYLTSISIAEIAFGIELAPSISRRNDLEKRFRQFRALGFDSQILSFDEAAAQSYAVIAATRKRMGRPIAEFDAQIASIAAARGFSVATRNVRDFEHCGINVINPWEDE